MAYDAFISYSHAADGRLAPALQSGLQRLAKPWYRLRALRVFRDETGLSTNPHLWPSIEAALDESEWFVLLASPESASSPWVDKEIAHWLDTKSADRILSIVTSGDWGWDPIAGRLVGDAVPERLAAALAEEPRHLDLRWAAGETDLDLRNSGFRSAVADLAAPMHGLAKDELEGEDIRQHRRARRLARAAATVVVLLLVMSLVFGGLAISQRNRANGEARRAELRGLVSESRALVLQDHVLALLLAAEAYGRAPDANARDALLTAVLDEPRLQRSFGPTAGVVAAGRLTGTRVAVAVPTAPVPAPGHGHDLSAWNWKTGLQVAWPAAPRVRAGRACSGAVGLATSLDGERVAVVTADGMLQMFSGRTLAAKGEPVETGLAPFRACDAPIAFSPTGRWLAVANGTSLLNFNGTFTGKTVALFQREGDRWQPGPPLTGHRVRVDALAFSKDSLHLATSSPAGPEPKTEPAVIVLHDVDTGSTRQVIEPSVDPTSLALDWDRRRVIAGSLVGGTFVYDIDPPFEFIRHIGGTGVATVPSFNAAWTQLGIAALSGFQLHDAAGLEPIDSAIQPNSGSGPMIELPHGQILLTGYAGPMTVWDLSGTSVLVRVITKLAFVGPTFRPDVFIASKVTSAGNFITVTGPGPDYRPRSHEIRIGATQIVPTAWCADPGTNRIATMGTGSPDHPGDVTVVRGVPPFDVISRVPRLVDVFPPVCTWRPDGKQIALSNVGSPVALYYVATGAIRHVDAHQSGPAYSLSYQADSSELWVTGPGSTPARISHLDGKPRVTFPALGVVSALRLTPDGRYLVTADVTRVRVLDARSLAPVTERIPATNDVMFWINVSADGRAAVAWGLEAGMRRIDLRSGRAIGPPIQTAFPGEPPAFSGNDTTIYAETPDRGAAVWDLAPGHVRDAACALAGRNLTQQEWDRYLPWAGPRHKTCPQYPLN